MNEKQKRTMILASIINTFIGAYSKQTKLHQELRHRIGKNIRKKKNKYGIELVTQIAGIEADIIWNKAIDNFKEQKTHIEASHCVTAIWNLDDKALAKHYGLGKGIIGDWAKPCRREDALELEQNGLEVANFIFDEVNKLYGIEVEKKLSFRERLELSRRVA